MIPSCFCTFATNMVKEDFQLFLQSLAHVHPGVNVVLFVDEEINNLIHDKFNNIDLKLDITVNLNKYSSKTRQIMEHECIFKEFTIIKAHLIEYSLSKFPDSLFLDADIFIINKIDINISNDCDLILSPHYIKSRDTDLYGYYNSGFVWTSNKSFPQKWREFTVHSRFFEQASLEDCSKVFNTCSLGENYNFSWWRVDQSDENRDIISSYLSHDEHNIYYKNMPLVFVHTHFHINQYNNFNNLIKSTLQKVKDKHYLFTLLTT
jgi:hypothetical protein